MHEATAIEVAAKTLREQGEDLVQSWIEWAQGRVRTGTIAGLPEPALRNHLPAFLESLAKYVENPIELAREGLLDQLRLHGRLRHDQGYGLEEVLAEFEGLTDIVWRSVCEAIEREAPDASQRDVLTAASRLSGGLRSVGYVALGAYSRWEEERRSELSASLEEFARAIAHELRTPLNTISLNCQVLRGMAEDQGIGTQLDLIESAVHRTDALLDTVRILAMTENARAGRRFVPLADAAREVLREFAEECDAQAVALHVDELPDVHLEAVPLSIVLASTLGNGVKYADERKDERWVRLAARRIEEENDSGFCELTIEDNGIGIPEEHIARVFQKGFRAHPEHGQGTGLGLYLVQQAVQARGGHVSIDSEEGRGTRVVVRLRCLDDGWDGTPGEDFRVETLLEDTIAEAVADGDGQAKHP